MRRPTRAFTALGVGVLVTLGVATAQPASAASATASHTAFTYTGAWTSVSTEHYTGTAGAKATINFTVASGGATVSLKATKNGANGVETAKVDAGTAANINLYNATSSTGTVWTSGTLAAGDHTLTVAVTTPYGSVAGATLTNGAFGGAGYVPPVTTVASTVVASTGTPTDSQIPVAWSLTAGTDGATTVIVGRDGADGGWSGDLGASGNAPFTGLTAGTLYHFTFSPAKADGTKVGTATVLSATTTGTAPGTGGGGTGTGGGSTTTPPTTPAGYTQTFADDFDGSALGSGWYQYGGRSGASNTLFDPNNITVANSMVSLDLNKNGSDGANWVGAGFARTGSGQLYGKFEARVRLRVGNGASVAGLLWPYPDAWPPEIDWLETNGAANPQQNDVTLHYGANNTTQDGSFPVDMTQWHNIGVEWSPGKLVYTLDGVAKVTQNNSNVPNTAMDLGFQIESHQFGTGGGYETPPDASTPAHNYLDIDWVREYRTS